MLLRASYNAFTASWLDKNRVDLSSKPEAAFTSLMEQFEWSHALVHHQGLIYMPCVWNGRHFSLMVRKKSYLVFDTSWNVFTHFGIRLFLFRPVSCLPYWMPEIVRSFVVRWIHVILKVYNCMWSSLHTSADRYSDCCDWKCAGNAMQRPISVWTPICSSCGVGVWFPNKIGTSFVVSLHRVCLWWWTSQPVGVWKWEREGCMHIIDYGCFCSGMCVLSLSITHDAAILGCPIRTVDVVYHVIVSVAFTIRIHVFKEYKIPHKVDRIVLSSVFHYPVPRDPSVHPEFHLWHCSKPWIQSNPLIRHPCNWTFIARSRLTLTFVFRVSVNPSNLTTPLIIQFSPDPTDVDLEVFYCMRDNGKLKILPGPLGSENQCL